MDEVKKIGFFTRIKKAIFNVEDYKIFAEEKFSQALKYIFGLIGIVTLILAISITVSYRQEIDKLISYIQNDFPDFSYENNVLTVDEVIEAYDADYEAMLIVNTSSDLTDDQLEEYKEKSKEAFYSFILLADKVYYTIDGYEYELSYESLSESIGIDSFSKEEIFENYLNDDRNTSNYNYNFYLCYYKFIYFTYNSYI